MAETFLAVKADHSSVDTPQPVLTSSHTEVQPMIVQPVLTAPMSEVSFTPPASPNDWMNQRWRASAAWVYLVICLFDFIIAPMLWSALQLTSKGQVSLMWQPLTLQGGGLFHMAFGAIVGITAHGRTREKIAGVQ
jgi:hypothetical protein